MLAEEGVAEGLEVGIKVGFEDGIEEVIVAHVAGRGGVIEGAESGSTVAV